MKFKTIIFFAACLTLTVASATEEEMTLEDLPVMSVDDVAVEQTEPMAKTEETVSTTTTRKSLIKSSRSQTTTQRSVPVVITAEEEAPVKSKPKKQSGTSRSRTALTGRRTTPMTKDVEETDDMETTSPASVDTASIAILAPKNFKPTPRPINSEDDMAPKGLIEFLKKRKMERIAATTTEDPFVAILATATAPATEEPITPKTEAGRFNSGSSKRFRGRTSSSSSSSRTTTTTTTTTEPAVEAPEAEVVNSRRKTPNRFASARRESTTTSTTTTAAPEEEVETTTKSKPKRPVPFRPAASPLSRRRDQSTTTATPVEETPVEEEIEVIAPVTPRSFRRANARISARTSGI